MPCAWVWLIPINQSVTSVGIVTEAGNFNKGEEPASEFFARHIASHPLLARRMARARPLHAFSREANYSYVMDRFAGKQTASWPVENGSNFPMALDEKSERILVSFRNPAQLGVFSMRDGSTIAAIDACGDADDLFVDEKRQRVYLSCGDGYLDVFEPQGDSYRRAAHIPALSGRANFG